ncbi:MAG: hypothetical protein IJK22_08410 [Bacteroidales bacterium]|nr:hypothetical protein [Bacteroidales bacterium]
MQRYKYFFISQQLAANYFFGKFKVNASYINRGDPAPPAVEPSYYGGPAHASSTTLACLRKLSTPSHGKKSFSTTLFPIDPAFTQMTLRIKPGVLLASPAAKLECHTEITGFLFATLTFIIHLKTRKNGFLLRVAQLLPYSLFPL